ncbi:hypothetical protein C5167_036155, partial [Papaver somniferum]
TVDNREEDPPHEYAPLLYLVASLTIKGAPGEMSPSNKIAYHARSISLPTRSNPLAAAVEEHLSKLRSSVLTSSISNNLVALKDLYECVEDFLSTEDGKCLDAVLDRSVMLLDVCGTIKDVSSQMKQSSQDLQSSIRRQSNELDAYMTSRKKVCKVIQKCLSDLKKNTNKNNGLINDVLTEVEATTLAVFESILSFLSAPKQSLPTRSNPLAAAVEEQLCKLRSSVLTSSISNNLVALKDLYECVEDFLSTEDGICLDAALDRSVMLLDVCGTIRDQRSLVSKLTTKSATQQVVNEVTKIDVALKSKFIEAKEVQKSLAALEMNLQELEDGLESVFRCLIKNRVSLLNILNQ